jgi:hypothetical protein
MESRVIYTRRVMVTFSQTSLPPILRLGGSADAAFQIVQDTSAPGQRLQVSLTAPPGIKMVIPLGRPEAASHKTARRKARRR